MPDRDALPHRSQRERPVEVRMEDGTWQPGVLVEETRDRFGHAARICWKGVTAWLYRERGSGWPSDLSWGLVVVAALAVIAAGGFEVEFE